jgi:hypothetical protein
MLQASSLGFSLFLLFAASQPPHLIDGERDGHLSKIGANGFAKIIDSAETRSCSTS